MLKKIVVLCFLNCISIVFAQEYKLGKVTQPELAEKKCSIDTSAVAAILFKKGKTYYKMNSSYHFYVIHETDYKIKIYKTEGLKWANYKVKYNIGFENYADESVEFSDAVTYNLEDNRVVKTRLENNAKFKNNLNEYRGEASLTMPNVKIGSIIEFKQKITSEYFVNFPTFYLQDYIPTIHAEYQTLVPEFYIYKSLLIGGVTIDATEKYEDTYLPIDGSNTRSESIDYKQINSFYKLNNISKLQDEPYLDNIKNHRISILNELERLRLPNEPVKDYTKTWEGVAKTIYDDKKFGTELSVVEIFNPILNQLIKNDSTQVQKINSIFKYVKKNVKWNNDYSIFTDIGVKKAFEAKVGNTAEVNFILTNMLNLAGIESYPVLICTKDNGLPYFPSRTVFNYIAVAAVTTEGKLLLDATQKYTEPNILPIECLNWKGRLIKPEGKSEEIVLIPEKKSRMIVNLSYTIDPTGTIIGATKIQKTDYQALEFREANCDLNTENYIEKLEKSLRENEIFNYSNNCKITDFETPLEENFEFKSNNHIDHIGDKMYINPMLFFNRYKNPFTQEKRNFPVYFGYPKEFRYMITITVPDGYAIESLPKKVNLAAVENIGTLRYAISVNDNKIQISINETIGTAIVAADYYDVLQDFFKLMVEKENEKIVLKKI